MATLDMDALTPKQREVLGQIACNNDQGHPLVTLLALAKRGLIVGWREELPGRPPMQVTRWEVPIDVHIQWAAWCAKQLDSEEG